MATTAFKTSPNLFEITAAKRPLPMFINSHGSRFYTCFFFYGLCWLVTRSYDAGEAVFQELIEQHVTIQRLTTSMPGFRFVLAMILALYVGFSRLNHLQFLGREPMLTGILEVGELPVQSTFWRFLASLHLVVARQLLEVGRQMRQRVWEAAHVGLKEVTLDTDTTVQTVYGRQMGARKGYNPKHRGKKSYQPILTFLAETREYLGGELRKGDRPTGKQIATHLEGVFAALPETVERVYARADSGFYCW